MFTESDNFIDNITQLVIQNQGLNFSSHRDAQRYLDKTKADIRKLMQQNNALFIEGLTYLRDNNQNEAHSYVAHISGKILKNLDSAKKLSKLIEQEVINRDMSLFHFSEAVNEFYECGDYHKELCLISVLMALFPLNAQPYVYYGSLSWRKDGKHAAEAFYSKIIEVIHDPALDYFAADCFIKTGNKEKARKLLLQSQQNKLMELDIYKDVKKNIQDLLDQC